MSSHSHLRSAAELTRRCSAPNVDRSRAWGRDCTRGQNARMKRLRDLRRRARPARSWCCFVRWVFLRVMTFNAIDRRRVRAPVDDEFSNEGWTGGASLAHASRGRGRVHVHLARTATRLDEVQATHELTRAPVVFYRAVTSYRLDVLAAVTPALVVSMGCCSMSVGNAAKASAFLLRLSGLVYPPRLLIPSSFSPRRQESACALTLVRRFASSREVVGARSRKGGGSQLLVGGRVRDISTLRNVGNFCQATAGVSVGQDAQIPRGMAAGVDVHSDRALANTVL